MPVLLPRVSTKPLALVAQGFSNAAIAVKLVATRATVAKDIRNTFVKLNLPESPDQHGRVLVVRTYLQEEHPAPDASQ